MYHIEQYSILQWPVIFMAYCIFGWIFESCYCALKSGHLQNRGFCHGPWLPIYGTGATLLVLIAGPYRENHIAVFLIGVLGGTLLELVTGYLMEKIFHMRWWDYSQNPLNFHGYICLFASLGWGFLAVFLLDYIHPHVEAISENWSYSMFLVANTALYTLFIEDVVLSVIAAMDLRNRLQAIAENSDEIQRLKAGLQEVYEKLEETKKEIDAGVEAVSEVRRTEGNVKAALVVAEGTKRLVKDGAEAALQMPAAGAKAVTGETRKLLQAQKEGMERRLQLLQGGGGKNRESMNWWSKAMLRNNPDAVSKEPSFSLLKEAALRRREKRSEDETAAE